MEIRKIKPEKFITGAPSYDRPMAREYLKAMNWNTLAEWIGSDALDAPDYFPVDQVLAIKEKGQTIVFGCYQVRGF